MLYNVATSISLRDIIGIDSNFCAQRCVDVLNEEHNQYLLARFTSIA